MQSPLGSPSPAAVAPIAALPVTDDSSNPAQGHGLVRNTLYLTLAQVITIPISIAANAVVGRYLGPAQLGLLYTAGALCAFAVLALEWGQSGAIPALVARSRGDAGKVLGTSFAWRGLMALPLAAVLALACWLLNYPTALRWTVALSFPLAVLNSFGTGLKDTIRGFERTDIPAKAHVSQQLMMLVLVMPVLLLGGQLRSMLLAYIGIALAILIYLLRQLRPLLASPIRVDSAMFQPVFRAGTPFVFFGLAMVAQPYLDATFLSKMAPGYVVGWHAAAQRLIGLLIFPAGALIGALYPTLCRLANTDEAEFLRVTRNALYGVSLLAVPAALGCALFPELGVMIFGEAKFGGAEGNLRVLSIFLFLVYFSMPLGTCVLAANRQKVWALVQCVSIGISCTFNPLLIPYFQRIHGNGSLATCWGIVCGEAIIVLCGLWISPRGLLDRGLLKSLLLSGVAGAVMAALAILSRPISLFLAVPLSLIGYGLTAWLTGAVQPSTTQLLKGFIVRKLKRSAS